MKRKIKKTRIKPYGLYGAMLKRLANLETNVKGLKDNETITNSHINQRLCRNLSINRHELKELLRQLRDEGLIEMNNHGIRLNFELEEDGNN